MKAIKIARDFISTGIWYIIGMIVFVSLGYLISNMFGAILGGLIVTKAVYG